MEEEIDQLQQVMPMPGEVYEIFEQDNQMSNVLNPSTAPHLFHNPFDVSMNPLLSSSQMPPFQHSSIPSNVLVFQQQQAHDHGKNVFAPMVSSFSLMKPKRFRWNPEVHARFVQIVNHLAINRLKITPKSIQNYMSELTLAQIKSHLQKFRKGEQIRKQNLDVGENSRNEEARKAIRAPPSYQPNMLRASSSTPGVVIQDAFGNNEEEIVRNGSTLENEMENNLMQPQVQSYEFGGSSQLQPQLQSYEFGGTSQLQPQTTLQSYEFGGTSQLQPQPQPTMQSYDIHGSSLPYTTMDGFGNFGNTAMGGFVNFSQEGSITAANTFPSWNPNPHSITSSDVQTPLGFAPNHPSNEHNNYVFGGSVFGGSTHVGERGDWTREPEVDPNVVGGSTVGERGVWTREPEVDPNVFGGSTVGEQGDWMRAPEVDPDADYLNFDDALASLLRDFNEN